MLRMFICLYIYIYTHVYRSLSLSLSLSLYIYIYIRTQLYIIDYIALFYNIINASLKSPGVERGPRRVRAPHRERRPGARGCICLLQVYKVFVL